MGVRCGCEWHLRGGGVGVGEGGFWVIWESWLLKMSLVVVGSGRIKGKFSKEEELGRLYRTYPFSLTSKTPCYSLSHLLIIHKLPPPHFPLSFPQTTSHQSRLPPHHPSPTQLPLLIMKVSRLSLPTSASTISSPCLICSPALPNYSFSLLFSSHTTCTNPITRNNNCFRELCQSNQSNPPH